MTTVTTVTALACQAEDGAWIYGEVSWIYVCLSCYIYIGLCRVRLYLYHSISVRLRLYSLVLNICKILPSLTSGHSDLGTLRAEGRGTLLWFSVSNPRAGNPLLNLLESQRFRNAAKCSDDFK